VHAAGKAHARRRTLSAMMLADVTVVLLAAPSIMTPFMRCTIRLEPFSMVGSICMLVRSVDCAPAATLVVQRDSALSAQSPMKTANDHNAFVSSCSTNNTMH